MYVIQFRIHDWDKWDTWGKQYSTLKDAQIAFRALPIKAGHRIAEEYTVVRYKSVSNT